MLLIVLTLTLVNATGNGDTVLHADVRVIWISVEERTDGLIEEEKRLPSNPPTSNKTFKKLYRVASKNITNKFATVEIVMSSRMGGD